MKEKINIVWLKRDLRTQDHQPLQFADDANIPFIIIYILEPSMIKRADWSLQDNTATLGSFADTPAQRAWHRGQTKWHKGSS